MQETIQKPKQPQQEKLTNIPAALTHASPPPQITTQPIPTTKQQPTKPTPEPKPIPKETQIILKGLQQVEASLSDIQGVIFGMRQQILQLYVTVDYQHISYAFQPDLADNLNFTEKDGYWIIKPKAYLGGDLFAEVAEVVKGLGGEYISAGKESHFKVKRN